MLPFPGVALVEAVTCITFGVSVEALAVYSNGMAKRCQTKPLLSIVLFTARAKTLVYSLSSGSW